MSGTLDLTIRCRYTSDTKMDTDETLILEAPLLGNDQSDDRCCLSTVRGVE